jgi:hypothetical protein
VEIRAEGTEEAEVAFGDFAGDVEVECEGGDIDLVSKVEELGF